MTDFNKLQSVKRQFFAMRNGVLADYMRRNGSPYRIIFGLNLPQIVDIARQLGEDDELAEQLWANDTTRESRLLAPMLMSAAQLTSDHLMEMAETISDVEVADNFVHRAVRRSGDVDRLLTRLGGSERAIERYMALRLVYSRVESDFARALAMADAELQRDEPLTCSLAAMVKADAEWYAEEEN
jgi:3-methyladenine DNA glycosylase AlkD